MKKRNTKMVRALAKLVIAIILTVVLILIMGSLSGCRWIATGVGNRIDYIDQKIDDATNYETIKKVEDTCRAMIASYEADKLTYEQYNGSANQEQQSWADQARMRANKTAVTYNEYILKNSFVWDGNVPSDIRRELPPIQ